MVFVNETCIGCGVCESIAEWIFKVEDGMSHVIKQPENEAENAATKDAIGACPVNAIQEGAPIIEIASSEKMAA